MPKITVSQLFVMLFLCRLFSFFTVLPGRNSVNGNPMLLGYLLFALSALLLMLPASAILRKQRAGGVLEFAYAKSKPVGVVCALFFGFLTLFHATDCLLRYGAFLSTAVYPEEPMAPFILLFALAALYIAWLGLESCARVSGFVLAALLLSLFIVAASLAGEWNLIGIASPLIDGAEPVARGALDTLFDTGELFLVLLFLPYLRGNVRKGFFWWVAALFAVFEGITLLSICSVGDYAATQSYPVYAIAKMAKLFRFQRMDAVHMVIWTMAGLIKAALYLWSSRKCFGFLFGAHKGKNALLPILAGISVIAALGLGYFYQAMQQVYSVIFSGIPLLTAVLLLPCLLALIPSRKESK